MKHIKKLTAKPNGDGKGKGTSGDGSDNTNVIKSGPNPGCIPLGT